MSAQEERTALTSRPSLYAYALRGTSDALPDEPPGPEGPGLRGPEAAAAVRASLGPLLAGPDTPEALDELHRRLAELPVLTGHVVSVALSMPLDDEAAARAIGRRLVRTGTTRRPVSLGLALLRRLGEPEDVPSIVALSRLRRLSRLAVTALERLDPRTAALRWLDSRIREAELRPLVDALLSDPVPDIRELLIRQPLAARSIGPAPARRVAEATGLAGLLARDPVDPRLLAKAARLLVRMASQQDYEAEILHYDGAAAACEALVRRASVLPPTVEHAAVLLSLAVDLHSGPTHLLPWRDGQREQLLDALGALLGSPAWAGLFAAPAADAPPAVRRRAAWLTYTSDRVFRAPGPPGRLRIEVLSRDPADLTERVETRFLIDGRPLVPEVFGRGAGHPPEDFLDTGALRATEEPREVQLAEAWCTEGCCGALYVTVVREGGTVVWRDWRRPARLPSGAPAPVLPAYRFDAAAYDAELARAAGDERWSWPARTTGRLLDAALRKRPELLARWDARFHWVGADYRDPDTTAVWFRETGAPGADGPVSQFVWRLPDDGAPPDERAAAALDRLAREDPRGYAGQP
ncbi:hypothetical protein [Streptomyces sp. NPDC004267]|uniref:hypothetical protein n=1 Tax=Streptomyces sp. NPDC004267 TaxID=3364694 RepID=UPI0036BEC405